MIVSSGARLSRLRQPALVIAVARGDRKLHRQTSAGGTVHRRDQLERISRISQRHGQGRAGLQRLVKAQELPGVTFGLRLECGQCSVDGLLKFWRVGREGPRITRTGVRTGVALGDQVGERETVAADLSARAERHRKADQRAVVHFEGHGGTILNLNRIDPRGDPRVNAFDAAHDATEHVMCVNGVPEQPTAELGRPFAAPFGNVIPSAAPPVCFDGGDMGFTEQSVRFEQLEFLQSVPETVLKDRHDSVVLALLERRSFQRDQGIHVFERCRDWFLADGVFTGLNRLCDHRYVQVRRCANVDQVDVVALKQLVERGREADCTGPIRASIVRANPVHFVRQRLGFGGVQIADADQLEMVRQGVVGQRVRPTDAATDDGDPQARRGGPLGPNDPGGVVRVQMLRHALTPTGKRCPRRTAAA